MVRSRQSEEQNRRNRVGFSWSAAACLLGLGLFGGEAVAQEKPIGRTPLCATESCHVGIVARKNMHAPVRQRLCSECHKYDSPADHTFRFPVAEEELCAQCHISHERAVVHKPVADKRCGHCHDVHGSEHPKLLLDSPGDLCVRCHKQDFSKRSFVHGPVAVGACVVCHSAHSSDHAGLLVEPSERLCLNCHEDVAPARGEVLARLHAPMADGCTSCHDPHAGDIEHQLLEAVPELCMKCHKGVGELAMAATVQHSPVMAPGGCTMCHSPHFSEHSRLQRTAQPRLCLACHDEDIPMESGAPLTNMVALLEDNPNHHGPIREGGCTGCHQPHGGEVFRLLYMEYPQEFYAEFEEERYQLCFSCHLESLVTDRSGTGLTGFRDGDVNLHWLHVNRVKGRTCRACHEVHASKRPFHMREAVPFGRGGWELPLNFEETEEGGTCSPGCHTLRNYRNAEPGASEAESLDAGGGDE